MAYAQFAPSDKLLKVAVSAPWKKRTEARWHSGSSSWHINTCDYGNAGRQSIGSAFHASWCVHE